MLHLHPRVTDHLFYMKKRDGGLGFPHLLDQVRISALCVGIALLNDEDTGDRMPLGGDVVGIDPAAWGRLFTFKLVVE